MDEVLEISRILSFSEIRILLQSLGCETTAGFIMPEEMLSEEELTKILYGMTEKGILEAKEDQFLIDRQVGKMMLCMGEPERFFEFMPEEAGELPAYFCYVKDCHVLITQMFPRKKDMLKLTLYEWNDYERWKEQMIDDIGGYQSTDYGEELRF